MFIFALLFGVFWRAAWLYYLRHRETEVALVAYCTLLPFMITWMRGNFILPAMEVAMALAVVVVAAVLCRTRPTERPRGPGPMTPAAGRAQVRPRWPNLFLVGAAKAGTTSLYGELARHPAIYMSPMKEPHFFSRIEPASSGRPSSPM